MEDTTTEAPALLKVGNKKQEFKQTKLDQGRQVYDPKEGKSVWVPAIPLILVKDEEKGEGE